MFGSEANDAGIRTGVYRAACTLQREWRALQEVAAGYILKIKVFSPFSSFSIGECKMAVLPALCCLCHRHVRKERDFSTFPLLKIVISSGEWEWRLWQELWSMLSTRAQQAAPDTSFLDNMQDCLSPTFSLLPQY